MGKKFVAAALLAASLGVGVANAAPTDCNTQTIKATLLEFINIQPTTPELDAGAIDPQTGDLAHAVNSTFNVTTNSSSTLYLSASVLDDAGTDVNAFFTSGANTYIALANTSVAPTAASIQDVTTGGIATPANNPNVIAYPITAIDLSSAPSGVTSTYDNANNYYEITTVPGSYPVTTTIGTSSFVNTFSTDDAPGTYQAVVKLCATQP